MVSTPLMPLCFSRRDNSYFITSQRVGDDQEAALDHANKDLTLLALVLAIIHKANRERVVMAAAFLSSHSNSPAVMILWFTHSRSRRKYTAKNGNGVRP
jgi:hypothetical protein